MRTVPPSLIGLVSLQKETYFKVCPASHRVLLGLDNKRCKPIRVHIPVGHAIVFDSHLVHAGVGFEDPNLRLHVYFPRLDEEPIEGNSVAYVPDEMIHLFR